MHLKHDFHKLSAKQLVDRMHGTVTDAKTWKKNFKYFESTGKGKYTIKPTDLHQQWYEAMGHGQLAVDCLPEPSQAPLADREESPFKEAMKPSSITFIDQLPCCSSHGQDLQEWCATCNQVVELRDHMAQCNHETNVVAHLLAKRNNHAPNVVANLLTKPKGSVGRVILGPKPKGSVANLICASASVQHSDDVQRQRCILKPKAKQRIIFKALHEASSHDAPHEASSHDAVQKTDPLLSAVAKLNNILKPDAKAK